jgi:hypothetical protein
MEAGGGVKAEEGGNLRSAESNGLRGHVHRFWQSLLAISPSLSMHKQASRMSVRVRTLWGGSHQVNITALQLSRPREPFPRQIEAHVRSSDEYNHHGEP